MTMLPSPAQPFAAAGRAHADVSGAGHGAFDLPQFAALTYQEYTYCARGKALDDWLRDTLGISGGNHA